MTAKKDVSKGDDVEYKWGSSKVEGEVTAVHKDDVERTIKGNHVKREASKEEPAIEIKTDKGKHSLKSSSEVKIK